MAQRRERPKDEVKLKNKRTVSLERGMLREDITKPDYRHRRPTYMTQGNEFRTNKREPPLCIMEYHLVKVSTASRGGN